MKKRTSRTDDVSAPTFTGLQPKKYYTTAQSLALREDLQNGTHNPFERVDGRLLERIHYDLTRPKPDTYEESPF